jgi:hypothetical protein
MNRIMMVSLLSLCGLGCSGSSAGGILDLGPSIDAMPAQHAIAVKVALALDSDQQHATFRTQNGSTVSLAKSDLVGKTVYIASAPGGEPLNNATPIDNSMLTLGDDLTASVAWPAHYADGPWEVSCVVAVADTPQSQIPGKGDLAAFDNSTPPAGEPPPTGASVRVHVQGADASVTLTNHYFIRFGGS